MIRIKMKYRFCILIVFRQNRNSRNIHFLTDVVLIDISRLFEVLPPGAGLSEASRDENSIIFDNQSETRNTDSKKTNKQKT